MNSMSFIKNDLIIIDVIYIPFLTFLRFYEKINVTYIDVVCFIYLRILVSEKHYFNIRLVRVAKQ